jgi:transcription elongation factor GreA
MESKMSYKNFNPVLDLDLWEESTLYIVDPTQLRSETVVFGAHVHLLDLETEEKASYQIVGLDEADVKKGLISILSPLARAVIGKKKGDTAVVQSPKGDREYEILSFEFK